MNLLSRSDPAPRPAPIATQSFAYREEVIQHINKMSTMDMKLEDLDSNLDDADIENELSEFYSDTREKQAISMPSPGDLLPQQATQDIDLSLDPSSSTPSSVFQLVLSPSFESGGLLTANLPQQTTPSAQSIFTPNNNTISSPIFSPGALQAAAIIPLPQNQSDFQLNLSDGGSSDRPLPSEKYIRPMIYSPLNISISQSIPRFLPVITGPHQSKGLKQVVPLTPGSELTQSEDESSSSSDNDADEEGEPTGFSSPFGELSVRAPLLLSLLFFLLFFSSFFSSFFFLLKNVHFS
jgi:hypothetical protein